MLYYVDKESGKRKRREGKGREGRGSERKWKWNKVGYKSLYISVIGEEKFRIRIGSAAFTDLGQTGEARLAGWRRWSGGRVEA
jgi:hypothetical protein